MTAKNAGAASIGSTLGLAAGDCLGAALEGGPPPDVPVRDFLHEPTVWTDDTQQALVLIEATVRLGRPDPEWVAQRFAEMRLEPGGHFGLHRGTGRGFRAAVASFQESGDWRSSGRTDRAGNGASMRIAPVAVALAAREPGSCWEHVAAASIVTHREIRALAGALAVGWTAARLAEAQGYPLPSAERFRALAELGRWLRERERWLMDELPAEWGDPLGSSHEHRHQVIRRAAGTG